MAQYYHINTDNEYPYNVYGGMQDNGSWRGPALVWKAQGIRNSYWQEISFGDGFDVVPDKDDSRYGYTMSQQGNVQRYDHVTGNNYGVNRLIQILKYTYAITGIQLLDRIHLTIVRYTLEVNLYTKALIKV